MSAELAEKVFSPERLRVNIDVFEGPLDLLLYLIKKFELDIYDIPIAKITKEYLNYIELMKELNLDVAGEFLVMASMLINIKSKMLLPRPESDGEEVDENPLEELQRRLIEYQRYKEASQFLEQREVLDYDVFRGAGEPPETPPPLPEQQVDSTLYELVSALKNILSRLPEQRYHEVIRESRSITQRIHEVIDILNTGRRIEFEDLFADHTDRDLVIVTFLSILELLKRRLIKVQQAMPGSIIHIFPSGDFSELGDANFDADYEQTDLDDLEENVEETEI